MSYKPEQKTLETLEKEKKQLLEKIINGKHLDAISMAHLTKALKFKNEQIAEQENQLKTSTL